MQDLVRIGVADATDDAWIGQSPLERAVFYRKCGAKRIEIAREDIDSPGVDGTQTLLAREDVQGCAVRCAGFGEDERSAGKIEGSEALAACQLCSSGPPVQPAGNHQVQDQPEITFYSNRDSLADRPQFAHDAALDGCNWRLCGSQQERAREAHSFDGLIDDSWFECADVGGDIGQLWHAYQLAGCTSVFAISLFIMDVPPWRHWRLHPCQGLGKKAAEESADASDDRVI